MLSLSRISFPLVVATAASSLALVPAALPAEAQACVRAPVLREANVNQGLPYGAAGLAREKDTLVKLHLTANSCPGGDLQVLDGTLSVTVAPEGLPPVSTFTVPLVSVPSGKVEACCVAATNSAGDPKFRISGISSSVPGGGPVIVGLSAKIGYREGTGSRREVVFDASSQPVPLGPVVMKDTRPLRIYVVPMGRTADGYRAWFPLSDEAIVQKAMAALSRVMPLRAGVCTPIQAIPLAPGERFCGVQYSVSDQLLDLSRLGPAQENVLQPDGTFCGTSDNFKPIRLGLAERLAAYNIGNATASGQGGVQRAADLVIGLITADRSPNTSCAQGMASVGSNQSWVRLIPDSSKKASASGGTAVQEVTHNHGIRADGDKFSPWHSPNDEADGGLNRSHHLVSLDYIPNDRSVLKFSFVDWTNDNVALETVDWSCLMAALGGGGACGISVGSTAAAQGEVLVVSGRSDGKAAGGSEFTTTVADAPTGRGGGHTGFSVVFKDGVGTELAEHALPGSNVITHGHEAEEDDYVFDTSVPWDPRAATIEIRNAGDEVVWTVDASTLAPSNVVVKVRPVGWSYRNLSGGMEADSDPAISPSADDPLVAWVRHGQTATGDPCGRVIIERLSDSKRAASDSCFAPPPQDLDVHPDRTAIVMARGGNIEVLAVQNPDGAIAVGGVTTEYLCAPVGAVCRAGQPTDIHLQGPGSGPAYSPDGAEIAFSVLQVNGGELAAVESGEAVGGVVPPDRLTSTPDVDERAPSWSHTPGRSNLLVYERCPAPCGSTEPELAIRDVPPGTGLRIGMETRLGVTGRGPSWGDGFVAVERNGEIVTIYPDDAGATGDSRRFVTQKDRGFAASAADPSYRGSLGPVAFESSKDGNQDVWVATAAHSENEISVTANDDAPADHFSHMWVSVDGSGEARPVAVNVSPSSVEEVGTGVKLTFHATVDLARIESGGEVMAGVSDQAGIAFNDEDCGSADDTCPEIGGQAKAPYPSIAWPPPGGLHPSDQPLTLDGSADDWQEGGEAEASPDNPALVFTWTLDPPGPGGPAQVGTGARVALPPPFAPGTYTAELEVREQAATASLLAAGGCEPPTCRKISVPFDVGGSGQVRFDPATWHVPSNGVVTYRVTFFGASAKDVTTAAITEVNGVPVTQKSGPDTAGWVKPAAAPFAATLKVQGDTLVAKIDRAGPNQFFVDNGLVGTRVVLTLEGTFRDGSMFKVADFDRPRLQPA